MAGSNDRSSNAACPYRPTVHDTATDEPQHPFVAFKHFVDDNLRAITQLTSFSDIRQKMQAASEAQAQRERVAHYRWTGRDVSPDHDEMIVQRMDGQEKNDAFDSALMLLRESAKRNASVDVSKIEALYNDNEFMDFEYDRFASPQLSFGGACYYMPESGDNLPSTAIHLGRLPVSAPRFLSIDWFKNSVYSPVNIETEIEPLGMRQPCRLAFEDLLSETLSKPDSSRLNRVYQHVLGHRPNHTANDQLASAGPVLDWMLSLYCRGILPPHPSLLAVRGRDNFGVLEGVRRSWSSLAGSWAPSSAEKEFAELVRAVASPPAPAQTIIAPFDTSVERALAENASRRLKLEPAYTVAINTQSEAADKVDKPLRASSSSSSSSSPRNRSQFYREMRENGAQFSSPEAHAFWIDIYHERADEAAKTILAWEQKGRDVKDLIDDDAIVIDYILEETHPELWPLCEALEKANSDLLLEQAEFETVAKGIREAKSVASPILSLANLVITEAKPIEQRKQPVAEDSPHLAVQANSGILAALTTTQTTRMPDGSVTTKVVLKKRFADGREETTESVKVEYPEKTADIKDGSSKSRGWFWS